MVLNIDRIFDDIGQLGYQQKLYCLILCLYNTYGAWHMLQYTFVGYSMNFECETLDQDTPYQSECPSNDVSKCQSIKFPFIDDESTIVSDWNLVCDQSWLGPLSMSLFMAGVMVGALVMGSISDAIGRKKTVLICLASMIIFNGLASAVTIYYLYLAMKFLNGLFCGGYVLSSFVLCNELIGASKRGLVGNLIQACFAIGIMFYSLTASYLKHWRFLTFVSSLVGIPLLLAGLIMVESPRWLQSVGRTRDALITLKTIASGNGKKLDERKLSHCINNDDNEDHFQPEDDVFNTKVAKNTLWDLFSKRILIQITAIQVYSWFVNSATYYGLTLVASSTKSGEPGDRYVSTALSGLVEIPAYALTIGFLSLKGRRFTLCTFMVIGGCGLLAILFLNSIPELVNSITLFSKLCISASFSVIYIHSSEIFPTSIRNSAMGLVSVAARAGGIVAPFLATIGGEVSSNLNLLIFGFLMLSAGLLNSLLPETKNQPLPENVPDLLNSLQNHASTSQKSSKNKNIAYQKLSTDDQV